MSDLEMTTETETEDFSDELSDEALDRERDNRLLTIGSANSRVG